MKEWDRRGIESSVSPPSALKKGLRLCPKPAYILIGGNPLPFRQKFLYSYQDIHQLLQSHHHSYLCPPGFPEKVRRVTLNGTEIVHLPTERCAKKIPKPQEIVPVIKGDFCS